MSLCHNSEALRKLSQNDFGPSVDDCIPMDWNLGRAAEIRSEVLYPVFRLEKLWKPTTLRAN